VPPSAPAPHTSPATVHPGVPVTLGVLHVPRVAPAAIVHTPPQHSVLVLHTSPFCVQNDGCAEQRPFAHKPEQQSPCVVH
jgi:hypothetical protein